MSEQDKIQTAVETVTPGIFCSLLIDKGYSVKPLQNSTDKIETVLVDKENLVEAVTFLKMSKETQFDLLFSVTGTDKTDALEVVYHLFSTNFKHKIIIKSLLDKNNPEISSLSSVFSAANWHERETFDMLGIKFIDHPDLRRILLPEEWKGHPLRKDYVMDDERLVWNER